MPLLFLTNAVRDALFVLAVRNEINTTPHFDPVQSFSRLPCFLPSPVQQVAVEEDLLLVHTEWASAVSVTPRIGTLLTLPFSFTDGVVACPCVPTAQSFCPYAQRSSRLHPCLASDCVVLYSTEDGSDVAVLSSQLFLTGVMRVDQVQFCVAGRVRRDGGAATRRGVRGAEVQLLRRFGGGDRARGANVRMER